MCMSSHFGGDRGGRAVEEGLTAGGGRDEGREIKKGRGEKVEIERDPEL